MNTKGKEKEKSITESEGEATESNAHTPAREYYQDSEKKEPKTKAGKGDKNPTRKFRPKQMNRKVGSETPKQERTSRKGRRKRRVACNDTQSDKTKRRIGKKSLANGSGNSWRKADKEVKQRKEQAKPISKIGHQRMSKKSRNNRQANTESGTLAGVA